MSLVVSVQYGLGWLPERKLEKIDLSGPHREQPLSRPTHLVENRENIAGRVFVPVSNMGGVGWFFSWLVGWWEGGLMGWIGWVGRLMGWVGGLMGWVG